MAKIVISEEFSEQLRAWDKTSSESLAKLGLDELPVGLPTIESWNKVTKIIKEINNED